MAAGRTCSPSGSWGAALARPWCRQVCPPQPPTRESRTVVVANPCAGLLSVPERNATTWPGPWGGGGRDSGLRPHRPSGPVAVPRARGEAPAPTSAQGWRAPPGPASMPAPSRLARSPRQSQYARGNRRDYPADRRDYRRPKPKCSRHSLRGPPTRPSAPRHNPVVSTRPRGYVRPAARELSGVESLELLDAAADPRPALSARRDAGPHLKQPPLDVVEFRHDALHAPDRTSGPGCCRCRHVWLLSLS